MNLKSHLQDHFLTQLEALQENLHDLIQSERNQQYQKSTEKKNDYLSNSEIFFIVDFSGSIQNFNDATLEFLQFTTEELLSLNIVDLVPILDKKIFRDYLQSLQAESPSHSFAVSFITKANTEIQISCKAVKNEEFIYILAYPNHAHKSSETDYSSKDLEHKNTKDAYQLLKGEQISGQVSDKPKPPSEGTDIDNVSAEATKAKTSSGFPGVISQNPAVMSTVDVNGFIVEVNSWWLELLGYKKEEVLGKEALQFFHVDSQPFIADEFIPEIATTGSAKVGRCLMIAKNGKALEVCISGSLEYSSVQKIYKWFIFRKEHKQASNSIYSKNGIDSNKYLDKVAKPQEDSALSSIHHLKAIINSSKQILFLIDQKMDVIAFNKHADTVISLHTQKKIKIGSNILNFLSTEDAQGLREIYQDVLEGRSVHFTREMIFQNNTRRWFEVNLFPVEDELIHVRNVVFSAEDITERKQAEEKYKELEINFKSIFSQVAVGVMLYDLKHEIIQANKRFYELIEYTKEEFEEIQPIGITHPEDREKTINKTEELASGKIDNYSQEKRYVTKSGRIVWVFLTATVVKNRQGKPKHIISVAQDISLRKTAEQELIYKKSELDTFVYRASHDLRGPVASLMGLYNIVKVEFAHDKNATTYFEHYNNSVMRLHAVLQNLIDLTKIKESETKITQVDLKELIDNCLSSMKNLPDFNRIAFEIVVDIDFKVFIDGKRFKTIIKNLIENSIIYATPESTAYVKICVTYQENVLKVEVSDNGRGIDPRIQSKVFNMFFRGTEKSKGSGLGLYIVKNAVEKLNGSIQLSSKLNEGTKFSVYIPYLYGQEYTALLEKNFVN